MQLKIPNGNIEVYEQGQGDLAIVFLHYFGGAANTWQQALAGLGDGVRTITLDMRGFGASKSNVASYATADYADDVAAIVQQLELKRFMLVGHSMGGKIAMRYAMRQPEGLAALALLAPSPPTPEPMTEEDRQSSIDGWGKPDAATKTLNKITAYPLPIGLLEQEVQNNITTTKAAWDAWLEQGSREDISDLTGQINVPVYALSGDADPVIPPSVVRKEVAGRIKNTKMFVLPNLGHLLPLEAPQEVVTLLQTAQTELGAGK